MKCGGSQARVHVLPTGISGSEDISTVVNLPPPTSSGPKHLFARDGLAPGSAVPSSSALKEIPMVNRSLAPLVLFGSMMLVGMSPQPVAAQAPLVQVVSIVIDDIVADGDQLIANAVVTLKVAERTITQNVLIPINLDTSPGPGECDILNLSLGPVHLDLLGLVVDLDNCDGGPVTVDLVAVEGGGLLGDLLCELTGLLDGGLGGLTNGQLTELTDSLTNILNLVLGQVVNSGVVTSHQAGAQHTQGICDILNLEVENGIQLNLLGLNITTSPICLDVYAQRGSGNLLGNLLCSVVNLLNNPGNHGNAVNALLKNVNRLLDGLGL